VQQDDCGARGSLKEVPIKTLSEIRRVKEEVETKLLNLPGVTGVDIGYKYVAGKKTDILAIRVLVKEKKDVPDDVAVPKEIQGIPTDVIERRFVLHSSQTNARNENL